MRRRDHGKKSIWNAIRCGLFLAALATALCGCGGSSSQPARSTSDSAAAQESAAPYHAPPFADAVFHPEQAEGSDKVRLDLSAVQDGYVAVSARSDVRLKMQVIQGDMTYTYDVPGDGSPEVYPLQCGSGYYTISVLENVSGSKYALVYETGCQVTLSDDFGPFLRPSQYVSYTKDSRCVKKSAELAQTAGDALGLVSAVCKYVCDNISYDSAKAKTVNKGYVPDPDQVLESGKGICFDYAALTAAMLRSQGIPTRMIFGYVSPDGLYHAWNMFYSEQTGWVTIKFEAKENEWNRIDLTFAASKGKNALVGDGVSYTDVYQY